MADSPEGLKELIEEAKVDGSCQKLRRRRRREKSLRVEVLSLNPILRPFEVYSAGTGGKPTDPTLYSVSYNIT